MDRQKWLNDLKVGDKVFMFDGNRRRYDKDKNIVFRYHFDEAEIISETRNSWIVKYWGEHKVNKKTGEFNHGGMVALKGRIFNADEVEDECWLDENRMKIANRIIMSKIEDIEMLRAVKDVMDKYNAF